MLGSVRIAGPAEVEAEPDRGAAVRAERLGDLHREVGEARPPGHGGGVTLPGPEQRRALAVYFVQLVFVLSHSDSSILLLKNFLEDHPMLSSRRLFSALCVSQHTEPPFFLFFSAWLLPMFLPCSIFNFLLFNISKRHSEFFQ